MFSDGFKEFVKKIVFKVPSLLRRGFIRSKIAFGERYWYKNQMHFLCVDHADADININLETVKKMPFRNVQQIYSSHMLEHISSDMGLSFLKQCHTMLGNNGTLRIEVPDVDILIKDYKGPRKFINPVQEQNKKSLVDHYKFDKVYGEAHMSLASFLSLSIDPRGFHVPVLTDAAEFDHNINTMSTGDFCDWLISRQTPEEMATHGHINWFNFDKMKAVLNQVGFSKVERVNAGQSAFGFDLTLDRGGERAEYSLIIEARK